MSEALYEITNKFMMIKKFRTIEKPIVADKYDKLSILKLITSRAKEKKILNYIDHYKFNFTRKVIDMALVDKNKNPYSIASMASIYKDKFDDSLITSIFVLQDAKRDDFIKDQFLYIPIMKKTTTTKHKKSLDWAKEQAQHINVDMITDSRQDAVLERLDNYKLPKNKQITPKLL